MKEWRSLHGLMAGLQPRRKRVQTSVILLCSFSDWERYERDPYFPSYGLNSITAYSKKMPLALNNPQRLIFH